MLRREMDGFGKLGPAALLLVLVSWAMVGCAAPGDAAPLPAAATPEAAAPIANPGEPAHDPAAQASPDELLYISGLDRLDDRRTFVVDAGSGIARHTLPSGYISPDWSTLFVVSLARDHTEIRAYDLATGRMLRETTLAGLYDVPAPPEKPRESAFSPDGRWLALAEQPTPAEQLAWNQEGKAPPTRMVVLDTSFKSAPRRVAPGGYFWFDTLGFDSLYLIEVLDASREYGPGHTPRYQVRRYDLATGRLDDYPVVDKREPGPMNGNRVVSVPSADGVWLYSLYTREAAGPFIHVLNLRDRYAVCVDLPFPTGGGEFESELLWSMALSPDQRTLYAVNGVLGQVAAIDTQSFEVRSARMPRPAARAPGLLARLGRWLVPSAEAKRLIAEGAAVSPDGQTLFAVEGEGFSAIATRELTLQGRFLAGWPLSSLAVSPDGGALYAVSAERSALLHLALPLDQKESKPERIATSIRPWTIMRVAADR